MKKIPVKISWLDNYGAYSDTVPGCVATASSLSAVKEAYKSALELHLSGIREDGESIPKDLQGNYELSFELSTEALLHHLDGFITRAALSRITKINEKQLGHYIQGLKEPRKATKDRIKKGIKQLS